MKGYFKLHLYSHILDRTPNIMHIYIILYYLIIFAKNFSKSLCSLKRLIDLYGFLHYALIYTLCFNLKTATLKYTGLPTKDETSVQNQYSLFPFIQESLQI